MRRLTRLAILLLACLALFQAGAAHAARPPVVMLVFDEFPGDELRGPNGKIDAVRYPGFASLARHATWYPNATTVYDSTYHAVPAILDGRLPRLAERPSFHDHPHNLFTLLGDHGYRVHAVEEITSLCPFRLCHRRRESGYAPLNLVYGRAARLRETIASIRRTRGPTFTFHHALLPHLPWFYLPSGMRASPTGDWLRGFFGVPGFGDRFLTEDTRQRHLLQVGFVDHELGRLLHALRATGQFRRALIVVTADHGIAWDLGVSDRRSVTHSNIDEIAPVPLLIKAPGQLHGRVDRSYIRTIDIVPSVAHLLRLRVPWRISGHRAGSRAVRRRHVVRMVTRSFRGYIRIGAHRFERRRRADIRRRIRIFGYGPWTRIFRIGPHDGLVGSPLTRLRLRASGAIRTTVTDGPIRVVAKSTGMVPSWIAGRVRGAHAGARRDLAVALNGRVEAVGRSFHLGRTGPEFFSLMVDEHAVREGRNKLELFQVDEAGNGVVLTPLPRLL